MTEEELIQSMDSAAGQEARTLPTNLTSAPSFVTLVGWIVHAYDGDTPYDAAVIAKVPSGQLTVNEDGDTASPGAAALSGLLAQGYTAVMRTYSMTRTTVGVTHTA
ncbi:hypothetical protein [Streptomyces sp. enrichment culture]|uniref:hypothetical protein n=1 Tax=Streptomyces sp. enrichment culture TaxID=1795815 RepID=UPI003F578644